MRARYRDIIWQGYSWQDEKEELMPVRVTRTEKLDLQSPPIRSGRRSPLGDYFLNSFFRTFRPSFSRSGLNSYNKLFCTWPSMPNAKSSKKPEVDRDR